MSSSEIEREKEMAGEEEEYRVFVGGLAWDVTEDQLESAFARFGKVHESQIMVHKDTRRPRGYGFVTFIDRQAMEEAIREMHGQELGSRTISVDKAKQRKGGEDPDHRYSKRSHGGGGNRSECFKCGRTGHWARDCHSFSSSRRTFGAGGRAGRFGRDHDRYQSDDRYDEGRYGDRERFESREDRYGGHERYVSDRYRAGDRGSYRYAQHYGYGRDRDDRGYRSRAGPYDRPPRRGRRSSFDRC